MNNKEYFVSKLSFRENEQLINTVFAYEYDGKQITELGDKKREWLVNRALENYQINAIKKNETGQWVRGNLFIYQNNLFTWNESLPRNITKRKTFVSFYHKDDQEYREKFENLFSDLIVSKSVGDGDIDSDNSDEYIKQLIQKEYLSDTSVLVVLVGPKTKCRKHVDWEISAAINKKVGGYSGLMGILLPTHPDYNIGKYNSNNLPERLAANIKSGYAKLNNWTTDRAQLQNWLEEAFKSKGDTDNLINKSIPQMEKDTCE